MWERAEWERRYVETRLTNKTADARRESPELSQAQQSL